MGVLFVDTETTGLDPERHRIWELAIVTEEGEEHVWRMKPESGFQHFAQPDALRINRFYSRTHDFEGWSKPKDVAYNVALLTEGHHLAGIVPSFDERFLQRLLVGASLIPAWHYQLVDVEAMLAGKFNVPPPWSSADLCLMAGIDPDRYEKHTALGDAMLARDMYRAALGPDPWGATPAASVPAAEGEA